MADDPDELAALKGDARMATLIGRAARDAIKVPADGLHMRFRRRTIDLGADEVQELVDDALRRGGAFGSRRDRFRRSLLRRAYDRYTGGLALELDEDDFGAELLAERRVPQGDRRGVEERERGRSRARRC